MTSRTISQAFLLMTIMLSANTSSWAQDDYTRQMDAEIQNESSPSPDTPPQTKAMEDDDLKRLEALITSQNPSEPVEIEEQQGSGLTIGGIFGSIRDIFVEEEQGGDNTEDAPSMTIYDADIAPKKPAIKHTPIKPKASDIHVHHPKKPNTYPAPRIRPMLAWDKPLSSANAKRYQRIFKYQRQGRWDDANKQLMQLTDMRLRGHVLFYRFMHASYRSEFAELQDWLALYHDHPHASKVYKLAVARKPSGVRASLRRPSSSRNLNRTLPSIMGIGKRYASGRARSNGQRSDLRKLTRYIERDLQKGAPTQALNRLDKSPARRYMDRKERDMIRARIAAGYLHSGKADKALKLASEVSKRSGEYAPLAAWVAGMVHWKQQDYTSAAARFEQVATSQYISTWTVSAGAYWASRAHMRLRNLDRVSHWLKIAARHPRTFYGLLATRALGQDFDFNWTLPQLANKQKSALRKKPNAARAALLTQIDRTYEAEQELRLITLNGDKSHNETILAYAKDLGLPAFMMRYGAANKKSDDMLYDAALYPSAPWKPKRGDMIDTALMNALIRQESRFNPAAVSSSGAIGLMQIMPTTARHVDRKNYYSSRAGQERLADPKVNITLGQKYVTQLLRMEAVNKDLLSMAIAYNAGPGNLRKWKKQIDTTDALFFIENIPLAETRSYVERVLSNFWIYRLQQGQPTPTLDDVASGRWTKYTPMDKEPSLRAAKSIIKP